MTTPSRTYQLSLVAVFDRFEAQPLTPRFSMDREHDLARHEDYARDEERAAAFRAMVNEPEPVKRTRKPRRKDINVADSTPF